MLLLTISHSIYKPASNDYQQWETITTRHTKMFQILVLAENFKLTFQISKDEPPMPYTMLGSVSTQEEARYVCIIIIDREYTVKQIWFERVL